MQYLAHGWRTVWRNEDGELRPRTKWILRGALFIALAELVTSCAETKIGLYHNSELDYLRVKDINIQDTIRDQNYLGHTFYAADPKVKRDVMKFICDFEQAAQKKYKAPLYNNQEVNSLRCPLSSPMAKRLFYFVDSQGEQDKLITDVEIKQARQHIEDIL